MQSRPNLARNEVRRHIVNGLLGTVSMRTLDDPLAFEELQQALELSLDYEGNARPGMEREAFDAATLYAERKRRRQELETARRLPSLREAL